MDRAIHDAQCGNVQLYSIYLPAVGHFDHDYYRSYWGQNFLSEMADGTGAESFYSFGPQAPVAFAPYLNEMNQALDHQYLLTFLAKPHPKGGTEGVNVVSGIRSLELVHADQVCMPPSSSESGQ